jgi:hypothetical protein
VTFPGNGRNYPTQSLVTTERDGYEMLPLACR